MKSMYQVKKTPPLREKSSCYNQSWTVEGMDCPSCVNQLEHELAKLPEISNVNVCFITKKLQINYNQGVNAHNAQNVILSVAKNLGLELHVLHDSFYKKVSLQKYIFYGVVFAIFLSMASLSHYFMLRYSDYWWYVAIAWGLFPTLKKAYMQSRQGVFFGIETLVVFACIGAVVLGDYFEASVMLILFMLGNNLERIASAKARSGVSSLMALTPKTAVLLVGGQRRTVAAQQLCPGDVIALCPGDRLPVDGVLLLPALLDQSTLTGESLPVAKKAGDDVMAGTLLVDQPTHVRVTSELGHNAVDKILHLIEKSEHHKASIERYIDRFSRYYTPIILSIAFFVGCGLPILLHADWAVWFYRGLALLLIACPCALLISTPVAVTSALAHAFRVGSLIKGGAALECLARVNCIVFDKTGTLTHGILSVVEVRSLMNEHNWQTMAVAVEQNSTHPVARAIVQHAQESLMVATNVRSLSGQGMIGCVNECMVHVVSPKYCHELLGKASPLQTEMIWIMQQEKMGRTVVCVCVNKQLYGLIALSDVIRKEAQSIIAALKKMRIISIILSGDNLHAVTYVAKQLDITFSAELLPQDKLMNIEKLKQKGYCVAMVGDGVNDAPALKCADIGLAMGKGSDTALEVADIALTYGDLTHIIHIIQLSRRTHRIIFQNIILVLGIKLGVLLTTIFGVTGLLIAVLADVGATLVVTANALRLLRCKKHRWI